MQKRIETIRSRTKMRRQIKVEKEFTENHLLFEAKDTQNNKKI